MLDMDDTTEWSAFHEFVMPFVAGAPAVLVDIALRRAAKEFFERTHAWIVTLDGIGIEVGVTEYPIELDWDFCGIYRVLKCEVDGSELHPGTGFSTNGPDVLVLETEPETAITAGLVLTVALSPNDTASEIPAEWLRLHGMAIAEGACAHLFAMPKKPWTDPQQYGYHRSAFESAVGAANIARIQLNTNMPLSMQVLK
jgi:hypothetical protein